MKFLNLLLVFFLPISLQCANAQYIGQVNCSHAKLYSVQAKAQKAVRKIPGLADYDVKFYYLDITADNLSAFIEAKVSMKAEVVSNSINSVTIELSNALQVEATFINGEELPFSHTGDLITITLASPLSKGELFTSMVQYKGNGATGGFFSGISNGASPYGNNVTWTLSEPLNAKDWFASKQVLEDKADSAYIFITVPSNLKAGSNGLLTNVVDVAGNKKRFEWKTRYPIAFYLISMSISDYNEYNLSASIDGKEVPIQNYIYNHPNVQPAFKSDMDEIKPLMELFSSLYGPYPFINEKYGHCMVPIGGAMEHQTMTSTGTFNLTLDAHELGHQWYGDNVTCATWSDIWMNEGFARYTEYLALEKLRSKNDADVWMATNYAHVLSNASGSVYVPLEFATDENRIFNFRLTYNKGGALVHMIRNLLNNDELFFDILSSFQVDYKDKVATGIDFRNYLQQKSGLDFTVFFDEWYFGEGYPMYDLKWNYDSDTLYVKHHQITNSPQRTFFQTPFDIRVKYSDGGEEIIRLTPAAKTELIKIKNEKVITQVTVDPEKWLLQTHTLARDLSLKWNPVTGMEDLFGSNLTIYPNPATTLLLVSTGGKGPYRAELKSSVGATVKSVQSLGGDTTFDTAHLPAGMYVVSVSNNHGTESRKVVIMK